MKKIVLYIIIVLLAFCTYLSISYAYYSATVGTRNNITANITFHSCTYLDAQTTINISGEYAVPLSDGKALSVTVYRTAFTVYNNCDTDQQVEIALAPGAANTMDIKALKYAMHEQGTNVPASGTILNNSKMMLYDEVISEVNALTGDTVSYGYKMGNTQTIPAGGSKSYYAYVWINANENGTSNSAANKVASLHLVIASSETMGARLLTDYLVDSAPKSGTDAVSNSPWILTSDRTGEYRYAGQNPDNYIQFNGELWRIIGVMPGMEYCTGTYDTSTECSTTTTGTLVKIIYNGNLFSSRSDYKQSGVGTSTSQYGSNDWSDSQVMLALNGTHYLKTAYDADGTKLHNTYVIGTDTNKVVSDAGNNHIFHWSIENYFDDNSTTTVYVSALANTNSYTTVPATVSKKLAADHIAKIATVKWYLYGVSTFNTPAEGSASALYNKERNINNTGAVVNTTYSEKRAVYWYGKIGLMYPSDYAYATNGDNGTSGDYTRANCLAHQANDWATGDYATYCVTNDWLRYVNGGAAIPSTTSSQWTMTPLSNSVASIISVYSTGIIQSNNAYNSRAIRPVVYLTPKTYFSGGTGTYNDPYTIQ